MLLCIILYDLKHLKEKHSQPKNDLSSIQNLKIKLNGLTWNSDVMAAQYIPSLFGEH